MFKSDWILASLNNPTYDIDDLLSIGELSTNNTLFLSKDEYTRSSFIQENDAFKDKSGNFSEEKFSTFYDLQASRWRNFLDNEFPTGLALDTFDTASNKPNAKVKDIGFSIGKNYNPDRVLVGVEGWRTTSLKTKSRSELAQSLKIYDPKTGEFEDLTPEDSALFSSPLKWLKSVIKEEPLVFAEYEEDEVDDYGIKHHKGDAKLNELGTYYYERLNDRSPLNKKMLSASDILTKEDSVLNKIDFLDSDDLEKSVSGVIAKNIAFIAPMFTPAAPLYFKALIAKELSKTLPMLHGIVTNLFSNENKETPQWMEDLAAKGEQLSSSNSEWSKEHTFSFENMASLISDVALLWGQLKQISQAIAFFGNKSALKKAEELAFKLYQTKVVNAGSDWKNTALGSLALKKYYEPVSKIVLQRQKLGGDLALAYMTLISNTDVYSDMLERGATNQEAAWVALGSTTGMYSVNKFLHLGEIFYDNATADAIKLSRPAINAALKEAFRDIYESGTKVASLKLFQRGVAFGKKLAETFADNLKTHNLGGFGKAFGEGLEEVSEEFITDLSKYTYSLLGDLGVFKPNVENTGAFENMAERYAMSLIGGAVGGGLFYGVEKFQGFNKTRDLDLVEMIKDGKALELRDEVERRVKKGDAGSTTISGKNFTEGPDNKITWLSTNNKEESQNRLIANRVIENINSIEAAIVGSNGINMTEEQQFDNMIMGEAIYLKYKNASYVTGYYKEFEKKRNLLIETRLLYELASKTVDGSLNGEIQGDKKLTSAQEIKKTASLTTLQAAMDKAQLNVTDFLSGDSSLDYTRKLTFALDPVLNAIFLDLDRELWMSDKIDPSKTLTLEEEVILENEWELHVKLTMLTNLDKSFLAFKALEKAVSPALLNHEENTEEYKKTSDMLSSLFDNEDSYFGKFIKDNPFYTLNSKLVDKFGVEESEDAYNNRLNVDTPDNELKFYERILRIEDLNQDVMNKFISKYEEVLPINGNISIDASINRAIVLRLGLRSKDIIDIALNYPFIKNGSVFNNSPYLKILKGIKPDLTNTDELKLLMINQYYTIVKELVASVVGNINSKIVPFNVNSNILEILLSGRIANIIKTLETDNNVLATRVKQIKAQLDVLSTIDGVEDLELALHDELYAILPANLKLAPKTMSAMSFLQLLGKLGLTKLNDPIVADNFLTRTLSSNDGNINNQLTIQEVINELSDTNSKIHLYATLRYAAAVPSIILALTASTIPFGKDAKFGVLTGAVLVENSQSRTLQLAVNTLDEYLLFFTRKVNRNPILMFLNSLKIKSHSPLENILSSITNAMSEDENDVFDMNKILNQVYRDYVDVDKGSDFLLNDTLSKLLDNADKALSLLSGYLYAASTDKTGLNQSINLFADTHRKSLIKGWDQLPEISSDYATVLLLEVSRLSNEINLWKRISNNNSMNKLSRLVNTASNVNKLRHSTLKGLSLKFTIDNKDYELLDNNIGEFDPSTSLLKQIFTAEQNIYNNFNKILKDTGLTAELFFEKSNFWENYLGNIQNLQSLETSKLNENLKELSKYDLALYLLAVLSENPLDYYNSVITSIKDNPNIAPLTVLQNISRLSEAAHSKTYKAGFKVLANLINSNSTIAANTVHINGVAGAGKTEVILKSIRLRFQNEEALIIGPTTSLAIKLLNSLNESTSHTLDIFKELVLDWDVIETDFENASKKLYEKILLQERSINIATEYFSINYNLDNMGNPKINILLMPNKIKFNKAFKLTLVFVDEAAHMNTLQIALLDAYTESVGGTVFLASDSNQSGYSKNGIRNLEEDSLFTTRTSKLLESLRTSNILKLANNNKMQTILDTIEDIWRSGDLKQKEELLKKLPNMISKLNLKVYNLKDDINGDLLGGNLKEVMGRIPIDASIGFIGDVNSTAYQELKAYGFTNLGEPLTETIVAGKKFMQGQEFDYVIIDKMNKLPTALSENYSTVEFLLRFYTLMSRSKNASIFLDTTLPSIVGENILDDTKSLGFTIINLIELFRLDYLKQLEELEFLLATVATPNPVNSVITAEDSVEFNPDATPKELNEELLKRKIEIENELRPENVTTLSIEVSDLSELMIEANTVVPITGLQETLVNSDGTARRYPMWIPGQKTPIRRNINAFYHDDAPITKRVDKLRLLDTISRIQSAVIFGSDITDPALTSLIGFGEAWKNRTIQLEIRKATEVDKFGIGTDLKPTYIDVDGVPYIVSITCKLDGLSKNILDTPYSAIFDICLLSDFNHLRKPQTLQLIKDSINAKIKSGVITDIAKAEKYRDNLGESVKTYELFIRKSILENPDGFTLPLTPDMYTSHKYTKLVKRKFKRRLGGTLSIATVENNIVDSDGNYIEDYNNFLDTDKRKVVSPVYIVGNKSDVLRGKVSESVYGKAVVFVSSNVNLPADKLADMYIELKRNPSTHTPEVRMVLLDNHGLSFTELVTHRILKQLSGNGEVSKKPWRMDTLGVRMFTSMWNFRAGLENFISAVDKFKATNNYDSAKILDITKVESELFNTFGKDWVSEIESLKANELYTTYKITLLDIKNLIKFNLEDCKDIPSFRLGIDYTSTNIGAHVRQFDVSNSSKYGKKLANLLAIEEGYAHKYYLLLSTILDQLTANESPEILRRIGFILTPMSTKLVKPDGTDFKTNEYIEKSEQLRNLSGLIHTNDKNIIIGETDDDGKIISKVEIPGESLFSFFPKAITAIATKSRKYQTNPNASGIISISTIDSTDNTGSFDFEIAYLFGNDLLQRLGNDNTLFNMFNLIFHGTTLSIESNHAFMEDAPFKYGIFVDPDLESSDDYKEINVRGLNGKDYAFLRCGTNPIYFDVDVDAIPGGMALNMAKVILPTLEKVLETLIPVNLRYSDQLTNDKNAFLNYIVNNNKSDTLESYTEFITINNIRSIRNFFTNGIKENNILQLINSHANMQLKDVNFEGNVVTYEDSDGSKGKLIIDLEDNFITKSPYINIEGSFDSVVTNEDGETIMSHGDFLNTLEDLGINSGAIKNSTNVKNYLNLLAGLKEDLNNKIDQLEDSDLKWQLSDYLLFVDTTCF